MNYYRSGLSIALYFLAWLTMLSCKKESSIDSSLKGDWDIELTKVGAEFGLSPQLGGLDLPQGSAFITRNERGLVTFQLSSEFDLSGRPDSAFCKI
jgi:hypothetical protein